jgi:uncharacterized delta-60 repeat protein
MKKVIHLFLILFTVTTFSQSGEIDTTFGVNGKVETSFGGNKNSANTVAVQSDGKTIVGGTCQTFDGGKHFAIARYNVDGTLDLTFGISGKMVSKVFEVPFNKTQSTIYSINVLSNGKLLVVGSYGGEYSVYGTVIVRYNNNGFIDNTFGTEGKVFSDFKIGLSGGNRIVFQPDGKFILALEDSNINLDIYNFALERYSIEGVLDETFGTNGKVITSVANGQSLYPSIALLQNGKFFLAGTIFQGPIFNIALVKYNNDGTLELVLM